MENDIREILAWTKYDIDLREALREINKIASRLLGATSKPVDTTDSLLRLANNVIL